MTTNVKMILDEVNARIKLAEAKTAEDPSNFDSFPGAENDKPVSEETKKPDPEVKEEGPASRTEVTGAEPGSDAPVQQDKLYEADEPVLTPEKKPAESADANAKEASANPDVTKVASDILNIIKGAINKATEKKAAAAAKPADKPSEKKAEEKPADKPAEKKADEQPADKPAEAPKTEDTPEKKAENKNDMISLENKILDKIAAVRMAKQAGANDAQALVKAAADYKRGADDAMMLIAKVAQAMDEAETPAAAEATPEEAGAADAEAAIADAAAADAAAGAEGAEGAEGGDDPVTPEEVVEAVNELVQEGQISEEDAATIVGELGAEAGGGAEDVSDDQIAEGIAQAIESGELSEDEAQQLVQELVGAGADESVAEQVAGDDAGATPEEAGAADAEAAIADAAAADEAQKTAAVHQKIAAALQKSQVSRYQNGFIQKCAEYGVDPQRLAQYIQARTGGAR